MAKGWSMEIKGLKELEKIMLKELPTTANRRVMLSGLRESAKPMLASAKSKVVKQSGSLEESLGMRTARNRGFNKQFASIHLAPMRGNPLAWAKWMAYYKTGAGDMESGIAEIGSRIQSGQISARRAKDAGIWHGHLVEFGFRHKSGKHVPARPFLRPAFDNNWEGFNRSFAKNLGKKMEAAIKRIEKKNAATVKAKR